MKRAEFLKATGLKESGAQNITVRVLRDRAQKYAMQQRWMLAIGAMLVTKSTIAAVNNNYVVAGVALTLILFPALMWLTRHDKRKEISDFLEKYG